jgi:mucin-19
MAITKIQAGALPAGVVTVDAIADTSITHAKLHTDMDLSAKTVVLPTLSQTITATAFVGDGSSLTGLPAGYTNSDVAAYLLSNGISNIISAASDPSVGSAGKIYYNTTLGLLKVSNGTVWYKVSVVPAVLSSISGTIYNTVAGNITLTGTGFLTDSCVVTFTVGATDYTVTKTADNDTTISAVAVPSAVYNSAAGTSVSITVTNSDESTSATVSTTVAALPSGGTITTSGGYRIHTFTSSGTFATNGLAANVEYSVIAGGAGGGAQHGGGGGAGGYRTNVTGATSGGGASAEATYAVTASQSITVTVGGGGSGGTNPGNPGSAGNNSVFGSITSTGGGGGGGWGVSPFSGYSGGSGGGSSLTGSGGAGTSGQGYAGGATGSSSSTWPNGGSGGGGAGAVGESAANLSKAGNGGAGQSSSITGSAVTRAGGGGGGSHSPYAIGIGGSGGGGNGGLGNTGAGIAATTNTGSGGGGSGANTALGGNGGSGIVIIRYAV